MQRVLLFLLLAGLISCTSDKDEQTDESVDYENISVDYPKTATVDVRDTLHGQVIKDPYRWLEVDTAEAVKDWVERQNEVTFGYLEQIPFRDEIRDRYEELFNYPKLSSPFKVGEYYFFSRNDGLQNQSVIYVQKGLEGEPEVFLDPNKMSEDGTVAVSLAGFSQDDQYVAYSRSEAGSDWQDFHIMRISDKKKMEDVIEHVKFSGASWKGGDGFYYSRYPEPEEGTEYTLGNVFHSLYYHKLGTDQSGDRLVYEDRKNPGHLHFSSVTEDGKYLVLYKTPGTGGNAVLIKDLEDPGSEFEYIVEGFDDNVTIIDHYDGKLYIMTDIDAPNYRLVAVDPASPANDNWEEIIPETENRLNSVSSGGGKLFANYLEKATNRIYQYDYAGNMEKQIELPGTGSAGGLGGKRDHDILFYTYTSFIYPPTIFKYNVENGESEQFHKTELKFDPENYEEKQVTYKSKDGTPVTMFIVHKKGLELDSSNPAFLYGYGGFNASMTPWFSTSRIILLENGGVFAVPNLRGGGEYGEEWHEAGKLLNKQNVFDDFIAAAEYLISEGYTSSDKLAIAGGSNGGLLVGACMTQRPDLFAAAFPAVGVMDMLRYHKFTIGKAWAVEYGSPEDPEHFENLLSYSPLHNLEDGTSYPATMITTADHDDRVVPAHSFKFAARLQEAHEGEDPVLIRIETRAGHGAGKPTSKIIDEQADQWAFFFYNTNSPVIY